MSAEVPYEVHGEGRAVLGRTKLYQRTRSPLIHGRSGVRRRVWPWVVAALVVIAAVAVYLTYLR